MSMNTNPAAEKTKKATFVFTDLLNAAGSWQPCFANKKNIVGRFFSAKCSNTPHVFYSTGADTSLQENEKNKRKQVCYKLQHFSDGN